MPPGPGEIDGYPAVSPDGRTLAFAFASDRGVTRLWLHSLDNGQSRELAGTEQAQQPFWSPDGRHLGFFAGGHLRRLEVASGHIQSLATASDPRGGTWTESGTIVFSSTCCNALSSIAEAGGQVQPLTALDAGAGETSHRSPWALPGGEALLFTVPNGKQPGIYWLSLASGKRVFLRSEVSRAAYDRRGYLLWTREGSLVAQRLDPGTATLSGSIVVLGERVGSDPEKVALDRFGVGERVVAVRPTVPYRRELRWVDRRGTPGQLVGSPGFYYDPVLAAATGRVAVSKSPVPDYYQADAWVFDATAPDRATRLSFTGGYATPVWSADGATLYLASDAGGEHRILARRADGSGGEEVLYRSPSPLWLDDSSRREPLLALEGTTSEGAYKLWLLPLAGERVPRPFQHASPGSQAHSAFSPDGRLLAYTSDESGQPQVYVQPVDGSSGRWQVTNDGGDLALWRADGKELFYVGPDRVLRALSIRSLAPFAAGETEELFALRIPQLAISSQHTYYQPSPDGQRFLVNLLSDGPSEPEIRVTLGWSP
jgi:Tol biopolymer transport system component